MKAFTREELESLSIEELVQIYKQLDFNGFLTFEDDEVTIENLIEGILYIQSSVN